MHLSRSKISFLALLVAVSVCLPIQSRAAYNSFLSITGISGPATNNLIPILSYSFGLSAAGNNPNFSDVSVLKTLDLTSPLLAFQCANAQTNATAVLTVVHSTSGNAIYTVTLNNVAISSYQISGSSELPTESLSLTYTAITWTYQALDGSGNKVGPEVTHNWNIMTHSGG